MTEHSPEDTEPTEAARHAEEVNRATDEATEDAVPDGPIFGDQAPS